ncbi:MAG: histidine kinase, partial [Anaerovoracaceae bacterium]
MKKTKAEKQEDFFEKLQGLSSFKRYCIIFIGAICQVLFSLSVFIYLKLYLLVAVCLMGGVVFLLLLKLSGTKKFTTMFYGILTYAVIFELSTAYFVDWSFGFQDYLFVLVPLSFTFIYTVENFEEIMFHAVKCFGIILACYVISSGINQSMQPVNSASTSVISLVSNVNGMLIFFMLLSYMLLFVLELYISNKQLTDQARMKMESQRVRMMLSQIKPHFMYNTLSAIEALITLDPKMAKHLIYQFSRYMRTNIDSLSYDELILFEQELQHVNAYAEIESLRFGLGTVLEYDIRTKNFSLPPLTLQPIVENAVKYGIRGGSGTGKVVVFTEEREDGFYIRVSDNGKGFDVESLEKKTDSAGLK